MPQVRRPRPARSVAETHREWLALVDTDGPFLAVPPLKRVYPQGVPTVSAAAHDALRDAKPSFDKAWDTWHQSDSQRDPDALGTYRTARDTWVDVVVREVLGWQDDYRPAADLPTLTQAYRAASPDRRTSVTPTGALVHADRVAALLLVVDPVDSLRDVLSDGWATSPVDRMEAMLRAESASWKGHGAEGTDTSSADGSPSIGVVTDGRWWALVSAPPGGTAASGQVDAQTWVEEPATRDGFVELLSVKRLLGGRPDDRLPALFAASVLAAEEITEALGVQVRRAVELVVSALSQVTVDTTDHGQPDPLPDDGDAVYQAVVTVLMRVVFLLFAQERDRCPRASCSRTATALPRCWTTWRPAPATRAKRPWTAPT